MVISNTYSDLVHYNTHLSAPLIELSTIFRIEGHCDKSCITLYTRAAAEIEVHRLRSPSHHHAVSFISPSCYWARENLQYQEMLRASAYVIETASACHSSDQPFTLARVTMLPSYLKASFLSKRRHLEAVFAVNKLHRSARIMLKFESNAQGC